MTEAKTPMVKRRVMSVDSPAEKAKAFVEATRKKEEREDSLLDRDRMPKGSIRIITPEEQEAAIRKFSEAHHQKETYRIDAIIYELKKQIDGLNAEMVKQQTIYNKNFEQIELALRSSWSFRIRNFLGL